ncbi:MAG: hypothetical protein RR494_07955 [Vagococcus sp.]|uniref:hypothetical protein n=1 Tax=Vagococcus sp. TaxID=1933889 RepID=UPI002FCCB201
MSRQDKIEYLLKTLSDRTTRKHLEMKSDRYIDALYLIESNREEQELDAMLCSC